MFSPYKWAFWPSEVINMTNITTPPTVLTTPGGPTGSEVRQQ
jgi:hypothetical protein